MRRAFTLVELMIVVAIMMVLAAIAIPVFADFQMKAKRSEAYVNVDGLQTAFDGYMAEHGDTLGLGALGWTRDPAEIGKSPQPWANPGGYPGLGWEPDGDVRGAYILDAPGCDGPNQWITGVTDIDGDGLYFHYVKISVMMGSDMGTWGAGEGCSVNPGSVCGGGGTASCY